MPWRLKLFKSRFIPCKRDILYSFTGYVAQALRDGQSIRRQFYQKFSAYVVGREQPMLLLPSLETINMKVFGLANQ